MTCQHARPLVDAKVVRHGSDDGEVVSMQLYLAVACTDCKEDFVLANGRPVPGTDGKAAVIDLRTDVQERLSRMVVAR